MLEKTFACRIRRGYVFRGIMHGVCFKEGGAGIDE